MRHSVVLTLCVGSALLLSACGSAAPTEGEVERALEDVNVIDESNLNDIMLTVGDPAEAVAYFTKSIAQHPERIDFRRGLASSLVRAKKPSEAAIAWSDVVKMPESTLDDQVEYADALIRDNRWDEAEAVLDAVPPTHETFKRYRLEAMIADSHKEWDKADSFYDIAVGLTTTPANVLNNWGFSKLSRGDYRGAEKLFMRALEQDRSLFTAKNNLVLARAGQRVYELPIVPMTQVERAELLYTMALSAIKQGDLSIGRSLLEDAIDTHPQHFEAAVRSLEALDQGKSTT